MQANIRLKDAFCQMTIFHVEPPDYNFSCCFILAHLKLPPATQPTIFFSTQVATGSSRALPGLAGDGRKPTVACWKNFIADKYVGRGTG